MFLGGLRYLKAPDLERCVGGGDAGDVEAEAIETRAANRR